jgi:hypothetical protein
MVYFIVYVSSAVDEFSADELRALLAQCVEKNTRLGVTGMLLYKGGNFMQVLEGDETAVRTLYDRIGADPRHKRIMVLLRGSQAQRQFPDWSMGFRDLRSAEAIAVPGYSAFLDSPLTAEEFGSDPSRCWTLLKTFKQTM